MNQCRANWKVAKYNGKNFSVVLKSSKGYFFPGIDDSMKNCLHPQNNKKNL